MARHLSQGILVVTTISGGNAVLRELAEGAREHDVQFLIIGDRKSPAKFEITDCDFYSLERQQALPFAYARLCPETSYARKNLGYLLAMQAGAGFIMETDDDNHPLDSFWATRHVSVTGHEVQGRGWVNAYRHFSDTFIYPRGFPIDLARDSFSREEEVLPATATCPIQQALADENPDVDAIYRMLLPLPFKFRRGTPLIFPTGAWCPFNSQNTTFFPEAWPLLYLPAFCSFRMTDIWRGLVAQRLLWTCDWSLSFHEASVWQERNEHDLLADFSDEIPGYLHNREIARDLETIELAPGPASLPRNLRTCYERFVERGWIDARELKLLDAWLSDWRSLTTF